MTKQELSQTLEHAARGFEWAAGVGLVATICIVIASQFASGSNDPDLATRSELNAESGLNTFAAFLLIAAFSGAMLVLRNGSDLLARKLALDIREPLRSAEAKGD
jgi:hypothetical protein